jgi:hypothetical protein
VPELRGHAAGEPELFHGVENGKKVAERNERMRERVEG